VEGIDRDIELAMATQFDLQQQYDALLRALARVQYDIEDNNAWLETLMRQRSGTENQQLSVQERPQNPAINQEMEIDEPQTHVPGLQQSGLPASPIPNHAPEAQAFLQRPICQLGAEILHYIFEFVVELDDDRSPCALSLSQVCRAWRTAAIQAPILWTDIRVTNTITNENVKEFWSCAVERVQTTAACVTLTVPSPTDTRSGVISECHLDTLPNVESLKLRVETEAAASFLSSTPLRLPSWRFSHLEVIGDATKMFNIDIFTILYQFPAVSSLKICSITYLGCPFYFPNVTQLFISNVKAPSLQFLGNTFPSVTNATFLETVFVPSIASNHIWWDLKSLAVKKCSGVEWESLMTAEITYLVYSNSRDDNIMAFVATQMSLKALDIRSPEELKIVKSSQIRRLTIWACDEIADQREIALKDLTDLRIYDYGKHRLSLKLFEKIVHSRCLSRKDQKNATRLRILVYGTSSQNRQWKKSELIKSAQQKIFKWNVNWTAYQFKWYQNSLLEVE
jgi:hypothetical protein